MLKTKIYFSPRKKDVYFDEEITVRSKNKPLKDEDYDDKLGLDGFSIKHIYELPHLSNGRTRFLEDDGTISLEGIFKELDEEREIHSSKTERKNLTDPPVKVLEELD